MDLVISVFLFALQSDGENFRLAYCLLLELLSQFLLGFAEKRNIEWKIIQSILTVNIREVYWTIVMEKYNGKMYF